MKDRTLTLGDAIEALQGAQTGLQEAQNQGVPLVVAMNWAVYYAMVALVKKVED